MSVLPIVLWPDPRLAQVCDPVGEVTPDLEHLIADMFETLYAAPGRGLAAPQVGVMRRLFITDTGWKEGRSDPQVYLNPNLSQVSDTVAVRDEGCLSIPGVMAPVSRPERVHLVWTALDGRRMSQVFDGFEAACVQHELDHLNGIVTLDHLSPERRAQVEAEYAA